MHVQLFDNFDEIFCFYNETKKNTSELSTLFKIPKTPYMNTHVEKFIVLNNRKLKPTIKI